MVLGGAYYSYWVLLAHYAEEGRSKFLLASKVQGCAAADEVAKRLDLWEANQLEAIRQQIEQQIIVIMLTRKRGTKGGTLRACLKHHKVKRMTAEGVYRKATTSLTLDMMRFSAEEDLQYVKELLSTSSSPDVALAPRLLPTPEARPPTLRIRFPYKGSLCCAHRRWSCADATPTSCCGRLFKSTRPWTDDACLTRRGG